MATTPEMTTAEMTRSFTWTRLIAQLLIAVVLFVVANVVTYETSGFFRKEHEYQRSWLELPGITMRSSSSREIRISPCR